MMKQTRNAILIKSQSLPEGNVLAGGWMNCDILGTYKIVTSDFEKEISALNM
jgi:hypothetical protein